MKASDVPRRPAARRRSRGTESDKLRDGMRAYVAGIRAHIATLDDGVPATVTGVTKRAVPVWRDRALLFTEVQEKAWPWTARCFALPSVHFVWGPGEAASCSPASTTLLSAKPAVLQLNGLLSAPDVEVALRAAPQIAETAKLPDALAPRLTGAAGVTSDMVVARAGSLGAMRDAFAEGAAVKTLVVFLSEGSASLRIGPHVRVAPHAGSAVLWASTDSGGAPILDTRADVEGGAHDGPTVLVVQAFLV